MLAEDTGKDRGAKMKEEEEEDVEEKGSKGDSLPKELFIKHFF